LMQLRKVMRSGVILVFVWGMRKLVLSDGKTL